jgi:hypothetical protein
MFDSKYRRRSSLPRTGTAALGLLAVLALPLTGAAQTGDPSKPRLILPDAKVLAEVGQASAALERWQGSQPRATTASSSEQAPKSTRERSLGRRILGGAVGAVGGFFAGGYLGAMIDGECGGCDDPGLKGALIGAPIGAAAGGILGAMFLF